MPKRTVLLAALATIAMATAACGSSGSSGTAGSSGSSGSSGSGAKGAPISVGVICSCSGPFGTTIEAAGKVSKAWANSVNAAGGINGHPVKLTEYDDGGNPGTSVTKLQSLISAHVAVIIDESPLDVAWSKAVDTAKIPVVGGNFSSTPFYTDPNFYPSGQTNDSIVISNILTAKQAGAHAMAQLFCAEAPQCQESVAPTKAAGKKLGLPVPYSASIAATAPNYTAQCVAAKQAGADALFIGHSASVVINVARDCTRQGYTPTYIEEGTGYTSAVGSAPGTKDHLWAPFPILPFFSDQPAVQKMNQVVDKYYPGLRTNADVWSEYAAQAWTAGLLVEKAVAGAGVSSGSAVSAADMTKGLNSLQNETLDGWSPALTFTAGKPHPVDCWYTAQVKNGTPTLANGGKLTCQNGSSS